MWAAASTAAAVVLYCIEDEKDEEELDYPIAAAGAGEWEKKL